ncbi:copper homeostasis protein CutC, partial [Escherichia coli]|uniref:copper homeostasis protein CutC n=1 Tax=Escherichia coli TaxID=562 RepID=UPI002EB8A3EE|nr:copper homeostasis protein CutC [Escherichia coli]
KNLADAGVARVLTSGQKADAAQGLSIIMELIAQGDAPTIMAGAGVRANNLRSKNSTLMHEETFGPVCSFIGYQNEKEALSHINASPFGLAASVWSENMSKALRYAEDIDAGMVWVNMHTFLDPAVPFGG